MPIPLSVPTQIEPALSIATLKTVLLGKLPEDFEVFNCFQAAVPKYLLD